MENSGIGGHWLQLYGGDVAPLCRNVSCFLREGLRRGETVLTIAVPEHSAAFLRQMEADGCDTAQALDAGRLLILDASETLAALMRHGQPDWDGFAATLGRRIQDLRNRDGGTRVRAYGEMVGLLWNGGQGQAACHLEQFWNRQLAAGDLTLFCAYQIDVFGHEFQAGVADWILAAHTELVSGLDAGFEQAVHRAVDEIVGEPCAPADTETVLPPVEAAILWLRDRHPDRADEVLSRAQRYMTEPTACVHS